MVHSPAKFQNDSRNFYKRTYGDALRKIIPSFYFVEDLALSGYEPDPIVEVVNSNMVAAQNIQSLLGISATGDNTSINQFSSISKYFIKQNRATNITVHSLETEILDPIGFSLGDFNTSAEWMSFVDERLAPWLTLNNPTNTTAFGTVSGPYGLTVASMHDYLINTLGWLYFLNTSALSDGTFAPSGMAVQALYNLYDGQPYSTVNGIKDLTEYLWRNYYTSPTVSSIPLIVPSPFVSSNSLYTSGTQQLEKLKTLTEVVYSPLAIDYTDSFVADSFSTYQSFSSITPLEAPPSPAGPFSKFVEAIGYSIHDINDQVEGITDLYSLMKVPDEYLPRVAELIGWELIGDNPVRWRTQLQEAVRIYKKTGTKKSLEIALTALFGEGVYDLSSDIYELYESYLPFMIHYALATESPLFKSDEDSDNPFVTYSKTIADSLGIFDYSNVDMETNLKYCVDHILYYLVINFPDHFRVGKKPFPIEENSFVFNYRDRIFKIPPYEEIRWYENTSVSIPLLNALKIKLACFGIRSTFLDQMFSYILDNTVSGTGSDISIGNSFIFYTSSINNPPNFSTILENLQNSKAKYLSLWSGKSSHFDAIFNSTNYTYSKNSANVATNLGLQRALKILDEFAPAHAIPRSKLNLTFNENMANSVYPCLYNNQVTNDLNTLSGILNAFSCSATDMGTTQLSSTGMSKLLVDKLDDTLISSVNVCSVPRNNLRRRNYSKLLHKDGFYDRTGFNMPISQYPSSLEYSLPTSGGGFLPLGLNYSSCEFVSPTTTVVNPLNTVTDPNITLIKRLGGNRDRWQAYSDPNSRTNIEFGVSSTRAPIGSSLAWPYLTSALIPEELIDGQNPVAAFEGAASVEGFVQSVSPLIIDSYGNVPDQNITASFYVKNYNSPGNPHLPNLKHWPKLFTRLSWPSTDLSGVPTYFKSVFFSWDFDDPSKLVFDHSSTTADFPEDFVFTPDKIKVEEIRDGWHRCSFVFQLQTTQLAAAYGLSSITAGATGVFNNYLNFSIHPDRFVYGGDNVCEGTETQCAATYHPNEHLQRYGGCYLWGTMCHEGDEPLDFYTVSSGDVWGACEDLTSSNVFNNVITSSTFPCRGVSSFNLSSILTNNQCHMMRTRGDLSPIHKIMFEIGEKRDHTMAEHMWPYLSSTYSSQAAWWDNTQSLINSGTATFVSSYDFIPNPSNVFNDPLLTLTPPLIEPTWTIANAPTLLRTPVTTDVPSGTALSHLYDKIGTGNYGYLYHNILSGVLGPVSGWDMSSSSLDDNSYTFSVYVKNKSAPSVALGFSHAGVATGVPTQALDLRAEWTFSLNKNPTTSGANQIISDITNGDWDHLEGSAVPYTDQIFGSENIGNGWWRIWISSQLNPSWEVQANTNRQFSFSIYPAGYPINNTGKLYVWGPMLNKGYDKPVSFYNLKEIVSKVLFGIQTPYDFANFSVGNDFQKLYNDYTNYFHNTATAPAKASSPLGGPTTFSHMLGPLVFNGHMDVKGYHDPLISSSLLSDYVLGESYFSQGQDQWLKSYAIEAGPSAGNFETADNYLAYSENFDPRTTSWKFGGTDMGALAASSVFPPWGPLRWGSSSGVANPPSGVSVAPSGIKNPAQFVVQGASGTNTWGWGSIQSDTPFGADYFVSAQIFSIFVKRIEGSVYLSSTDSFNTLHGMSKSDLATSSQFFGLNLKNTTQDIQSSSAGDNLIEFAWSGTGVSAVSAYSGPDTTTPLPSAITPSDCGGGWWRIGMVVSALASSIEFPDLSEYYGAFTSGESGRWEPRYGIKGIRQALINPAGFGIGSFAVSSGASSLSAVDYKGQYLFGAQVENLNEAQILALSAIGSDATALPSFSVLSSTYTPVRSGGTHCFDIALNGIKEYRDGSVVSGVELVIPSGSNAPSYYTNLVQENTEIKTFTYNGISYSTPPNSSYFKLFNLDSSASVQNNPHNPLINETGILINAEGNRTPRVRLPLSNTRYPVYRRDYVDYDEEFWPTSHLTGDVTSVQNSVDGSASINVTNTDNYLYRRALSGTSGYHGYIYEPKPQVPFNTKTSNFLLPEKVYNLNINYTSFNDIPDFVGGGTLGVWIHTLPEEGQLVRNFGQHSNVGRDGWVWSWTPDGAWVNHKVTDLESASGLDLVTTKLAHMIPIPLKEKTTTFETSDSKLLTDSGIKSVEVNDPEVLKEGRLWIDTNPNILSPKPFNLGDKVYLSNGCEVGIINKLESRPAVLPDDWFEPAQGRIWFDTYMPCLISNGDSLYRAGNIGEQGWNPATQCYAEGAGSLAGEQDPDVTFASELLALRKEDFYNTTIIFNTKNRFKTGFRDLPLSYKRHPNGNHGMLHRRPTDPEDFQYYVIEILAIPESPGRKFLIKDISLRDVLSDKIENEFSSSGVGLFFRFMTGKTNKFVGTGDASREFYTTSGIFEDKGGSRMDYRYNPEWGQFTKDTSGGYTFIDFSEGKCS